MNVSWPRDEVGRGEEEEIVALEVCLVVYELMVGLSAAKFGHIAFPDLCEPLSRFGNRARTADKRSSE